MLGNAAVLQQATLVGAEILGQGGQLGVLKPGALADVLVSDGRATEARGFALQSVRAYRALAELEMLLGAPLTAAGREPPVPGGAR